MNKDGLWNQLITEPDFWTETSGSAMFAYAMIVGVNNGWLNKEEYAPVARRAWLGLCNYINDKNDLTEVCVGTGKKTVNNIIWIVPASPVIIMDRHR